MSRDARWFGRLLDWQWDPQRGMHVAYHGGRTHCITKVDRRTAEAQGGGMSRGWHLWDDNPEGDPARWDGFGAGLGSQVGWAKRMAEAWIICPYADMMGYPKLSLALSAGAAWEHHLTFRAHDERRRIEVSDRGNQVMFALVPVFLGIGGTTSVRWRVTTPIEELIGSSGSWSGAVELLDSWIAAPATSGS